MDAGTRVYGLSRREPAALIGRPGFSFASVDLENLSSIAAAVSHLLAPAVNLDLVVLNAGLLGPIADMADADMLGMRRVMDVNVWANKPLLDTVFAGGRKVRQVVAISSGAAVKGARGWNGYAISNPALNILVELYAAERSDTHFSALAPGLSDTAMQESMWALAPAPRFQTVERLRKAAGTPDMPTPEKPWPPASRGPWIRSAAPNPALSPTCGTWIEDYPGLKYISTPWSFSSAG